MTDMKTAEQGSYGKLSDGREVLCYTLRNGAGMEVMLINYGAAVTSIKVSDRNGRYTDIIAGYDSIYDYEFGSGSLGVIAGRVCNRIARGRFSLDGKEYSLSRNDGNNTLHGGKCGFSKKLWDSEIHDDGVTFRYISDDGEEGFPGRLDTSVTYKLSEDGALSISYLAATDKPTIVNLTNHAYFNLGGFASGDILDHELWIDADTYLETDGELIPTGYLKLVAGTPFDFRTPKEIGRDLDTEKDKDLKLAGGYDHCFNFVGGASKTPIERIIAYHKKSGRKMTVYTDRPAVQLYTGNFLNDERFSLKGGYPQQIQHAFCLETQAMPDSINHKGFTDTVLRPGSEFKSTTIYKFEVQ